MMVTEILNFKRIKIFANILSLQCCNSVIAYYNQLRDSQKNFVFCHVLPKYYMFYIYIYEPFHLGTVNT